MSYSAYHLDVTRKLKAARKNGFPEWAVTVVEKKIETAKRNRQYARNRPHDEYEWHYSRACSDLGSCLDILDSWDASIR